MFVCGVCTIFFVAISILWLRCDQYTEWQSVDYLYSVGDATVWKFFTHCKCIYSVDSTLKDVGENIHRYNTKCYFFWHLSEKFIFFDVSFQNIFKIATRFWCKLYRCSVHFVLQRTFTVTAKFYEWKILKSLVPIQPLEISRTSICVHNTPVTKQTTSWV